MAETKIASDKLVQGRGADNMTFLITAAMYRLLAVAEMKAPAQSQGALINAGNAFDAMVAVGKVLSGATSRCVS